MTAALRFAVAFCDADTSWEHHDQTDDHPCTRCKRYGEVAARAAAPYALRDRLQALCDAAMRNKWHLGTEAVSLTVAQVLAVVGEDA